MKLISKIISLWKKPKIVVLADDGSDAIKSIAAKILDSLFKAETEVLFARDIEKIDFYKKEFLVANFDKGNTRRIKERVAVKVLTFGFQEGASLQATDLRENGGTNFKINYQGKIVPIWIESSSREEIYSVLAAVTIGVALGLNLVEISQRLREINTQ